jgi:hypothetical protein
MKRINHQRMVQIVGHTFPSTARAWYEWSGPFCKDYHQALLHKDYLGQVSRPVLGRVTTGYAIDLSK